MKVKCTIIVEVDESKLKEFGYECTDDYLNRCCFEVWNEEGKDIALEVREYEEIN